MTLLLLILAAATGAVLLIAGFVLWRRAREAAADDGGSDFTVLDVQLQPPPGGVLTTGEQVTATIRYRMSRPRKRLRLWVQLDGLERSTYEPSPFDIVPGEHVVRRWCAPAGEGEVTQLRLLLQDADNRRRAELFVPAAWRCEMDAETRRLQQDGVGARIVDVRFDPPSGGASLAAGTAVQVDVSYVVDSERGLSLWVVPVTTLRGGYAPSETPVNGVGSARRWFEIGEAGPLDAVVVTLANQAGVTVAEELVPVDYRFH